MDIVDAQVHIWGRNTPQRPWIAGMEHVAWRPKYLVDELLSDMAKAGIDGAVLVPPGAFEGFRNDLAIAAVRSYPKKFVAMGQIDFRRDNARARLERLLEEPCIHGMRLSFTIDGNRDLFVDGKLDWMFALLAEKNTPVMLYAPHLEDRIAAIAGRHEKLRIAICHANLDQKDAHLPLRPRVESTLALAKFPNVSVKASAL